MAKAEQKSGDEKASKRRRARRDDERDSKQAPKNTDKSSKSKGGTPESDDKASDDKASGEKLQKVLARLGLGSRREMEQWIEKGRLSIDGRKARLGDRVIDDQRIELDGRQLKLAPAQGTRCLLYNKPVGEVCSRKDPEGRRTVFESLPKVKDGRWISIGRLDYNTSGLLLFTTDGELANALMHPSTQIDREYLVRVQGDVQQSHLEAMCEGVLLEEGMARFTDIKSGRGEEDSTNHWFYVVLMEGRNREVRRLWESQGLSVSRLKRVRYGEVFMPSSVKKGRCLELDRRVVDTLYRMGGLPAKVVTPPTPDEERRHRRRDGKRSTPDAGKPRVRGAGRHSVTSKKGERNKAGKRRSGKS